MTIRTHQHGSSVLNQLLKTLKNMGFDTRQINENLPFLNYGDTRLLKSRHIKSPSGKHPTQY